MPAISDRYRSVAASVPPQARIRVSRRYRAAPERVFDAWLDPETAGQWLFATALRPMSVVSIDARAGGTFRFAARPDGGVTYAGRYVEIVRPRRLVFTFSREQRAYDVARVCVEIEPRATGCELKLIHENVLSDEMDRTEGRWEGMLYGLAVMLDRS